MISSHPMNTWKYLHRSYKYSHDMIKPYKKEVVLDGLFFVKVLQNIIKTWLWNFPA